jgi:predicted house-cleaning noncanonical NTP pyrophosphatase (MazG superfamily)
VGKEKIVSEKLVRDEVGGRMIAEGLVVRVASPSELVGLLARKLVEEAQEVLAAIESDGNPADVIEELGDVELAMFSLKRAMGIHDVHVLAAAHDKTRREGAFNRGFVWTKPEEK